MNKVSKRQKFASVSIFLTVILLFTQLVGSSFRYPMIFIFALITYCATIIALWQDIKGVEWLTLFILPTVFSISVAIFYFLLPVRWLTRLPIALVYGISIYAIFLSENIFSVAAIRTIQLHQVALAVSSFLSILTFFLLSNIVFSFHFYYFINFLIFFLIAFLIFLVNLWNIFLEAFLEKTIVKVTFILSLIIAEMVFILSFWPVSPLINSLFLTTSFYLVLGIAQAVISKKPLGSLMAEYGLFVFTFLILLWKIG